MRIGFDAKRAFLNGSGLGNYSRSTIDLLAKYVSQNDYVLYTPKSEGKQNYIPAGKPKIKTPRGIINFTFKSYWRSFRLSADIKKDNLDIFHGLSNELPHKIQKSGVKSVVTIHDLIFLRYPELYKTTDRKIYQQKFQYACNQADIVIAISEQTKTDIIHYFGTSASKIKVVYQGCNPIYYEKESASKLIEVSQKYDLPEKYLLYVGTIEERKNAKFIVETIQKYHLDTPLIMVGKQTDYQQEIEKYISKHQLGDKVFIYNNVPADDLPALYQQASIFIYPSIFEGFGIPILEALNSGTPVISTKGGCFNEAGGLSTIYVSPDNHKDLAISIRTIMDLPDFRNNMIIEGKKFALKFRESKIAEQLVAVYSSLL